MGQVTSMVSRIPNSKGILASKRVTTYYELFQRFSNVFHTNKHAPKSNGRIFRHITLYQNLDTKGLPTRQIVASRVEQGNWP